MIKVLPGELTRGVIAAIQFGHMAAPCLKMNVDYSTFERTIEEDSLLRRLKKENKKDRKKVYGKEAKKFLNIPTRSIGDPIHFTF